MVIDNTIYSGAVPTTPNPVDQTKAQAMNVTIDADEATKTVAQNITAINAIASQLSNLLSLTSSFNTNYEALENAGAITAMVEAVDLNKQGLFQRINEVIAMKSGVEAIAAIKDDVTTLAGIQNTITEISNNLASITEVQGMQEQVKQTAAIAQAIQTVNNAATELHVLYTEIDKLLTIYNYLPDLLRLLSQVDNLEQSMTSGGVSWDKLIELLKTVDENLVLLTPLMLNLEDLLKLQKALEDNPTIVEETLELLDRVYKEYVVKLQDLHVKLDSELKDNINKANQSFREEILKMQQLQGEVQGLLTRFDSLKVSIDSYALDVKKELQQLVSETATLNMDSRTNLSNFIKEKERTLDSLIKDYENNLKLQTKDIELLKERYNNFKEDVEQYTKAKIVELLQVVLEPVFKENNMTIDGLSKLLTANLANPNGEYSN